MSIITISRGSYSMGKEVAEKVAERLGYECIAREVLVEASEQFNIPEIKLLRTIQDTPSILERFSYGRQKYLTYIQSTLLSYLQKDNVVWHGFVGHFFVKDIPNVLDVLIIADMESRIRAVMERDRISRENALPYLKKVDEQRKKWGQHLYGIDLWDANFYDLVVHIKKIPVNDAVDLICRTVGLKQFQTTPESQKAIDDLALAFKVRAALVDLERDIDVSASGGLVTLNASAQLTQKQELVTNLEKITKTVQGVKEVNITVTVLPYSDSYD